jgi:hypothetical protein
MMTIATMAITRSALIVDSDIGGGALLNAPPPILLNRGGRRRLGLNCVTLPVF